MTAENDIIARLTHDGCYEMSCAILRGDAAREIERLRAENATLRARVEEVARERDRWMGQTF